MHSIASSKHTPSPVLVLPSSHSSFCKRYPLPQASTYRSSTHFPVRERDGQQMHKVPHKAQSCVRQVPTRQHAKRGSTPPRPRTCAARFCVCKPLARETLKGAPHAEVVPALRRLRLPAPLQQCKHDQH